MSGDGLHSLLDITGAGSRLLLLWSWQSLLLLGVTWLILKLDRERPAAIRHQVWLAGLLAVATLPAWAILSRWLLVQPDAPLAYVVRLPVALLGEGATGAAFGHRMAERQGPPTAAQLAWSFLFIAWAGGFLFHLIRLSISYARTRRLRRNARQVSPAGTSDDVNPAALSLPGGVTLGYTAEVSGPVLVGILRPMILLPADIENWTNAEQREAIIRHELAHLERRDHYVNLLQSLFTAVFFFHPVVRYALGQLNVDRELACDASVLNSGGDPSGYADIILKVAERDVSRREIHPPAFNPSKQILERRVDMILNNSRLPSLSGAWRVLILGKAVVALCVMVWLVTPGRTVTASGLGGQNQSAPGDASVERTLTRMYEAMKRSMLEGDAAGFERLLADDFTATSTRGAVMTRKQVVEGHVHKHTADTKLESVNFGDMRVRVIGETAVVTYLAEFAGVQGGREFSHRARITDVWERRNGQWLSIASHASNVASPQK